MKILVRFTARQEERALPILLRGEPGMAMPGRTYLLSEDTVERLVRDGLAFTEISRESVAGVGEGACKGERI